MLKVLPDLVYPITSSSVNPLMDGVVQLNKLDAGLQEAQQRALVIYLHVFDLYVKTAGRIDYRGVAGHERLKQDAMRFVASQIVTRHGDLTAAHLAIDWSDTSIRCDGASLPRPPADVNLLVNEARDLVGLSLEAEKRIGLLMDILSKKSPG